VLGISYEVLSARTEYDGLRMAETGQDQALNYPPVSGHPAEPTLLQHPRKKNGLLVDMNLPALPIQDGKFKFSFPMAALVGLALGLSALMPVAVEFVPAVVALSVSSVFFIFWAGTLGIPLLAIVSLIEVCKKQFGQAAYTCVILILDTILVSAHLRLTPIGQFLCTQ